MCPVSTDFVSWHRPCLYLVKVSALAVLLLPLLPAHAGPYTTPGPTGGQGTSTPAGPPAQPYGPVQNDGHGHSGYGASVYNGSTQSASATCNGPITTIYTWQPDYPDEPPPQQVVVCEICNAECDGQNYGASGPGAPTCDDGLADSPTTSDSPLYDYGQTPPVVVGTGVSATSSGTRYRIMAGGPTVTVTCSPNASLSISDGPVHATVTYSVSLAPLAVVLAGGIGPSDAKRYLIGQQCTATLSSGGLTPSNYNWTASGGDPFQFWTASQDEGELTPLSFNTLSTFNFHFKKPDTGTVSCTVDLAVPAGAKPVGGFPSTTVTQQCSIEPPSASFSAYIGSVMFINPSIQLGGLTVNGYEVAGIAWPCNATTPVDYQVMGTGGWNYVQLVTPSRRRVNQGIAQAFDLNDLLCLDNSYPYEPAPYTDFPGNTGNYAADGTVYTNADAPSDSVSNGLSFLDDDDSFQTWLMYIPPGSDSCYVPIRKIKWYWHGSLTLSSGIWNMMSSPSDCGWSFDGDLYPEFPQWSRNLNNDGIAYTPPVP